LVLWHFAGTKHFERYREENVIGRNVIERLLQCIYSPNNQLEEYFMIPLFSRFPFVWTQKSQPQLFSVTEKRKKEKNWIANLFIFFENR